MNDLVYGASQVMGMFFVVVGGSIVLAALTVRLSEWLNDESSREGSERVSTEGQEGRIPTMLPTGHEAGNSAMRRMRQRPSVGRHILRTHGGGRARR